MNEGTTVLFTYSLFLTCWYSFLLQYTSLANTLAEAHSTHKRGTGKNSMQTSKHPFKSHLLLYYSGENLLSKP